MRNLSVFLLVLVLATGAPAAACDMDGLRGFSHYGGTGGYAGAAGYAEQALQDAAREQAMADARAVFMRQYGLGETPASSNAMTPDPNAAAAAPVADAPPLDDLTR